MLGKEPTVILGALAEVIRAVIPMLLVFGFIAWTDAQIGAVMLVVGVVIGFLNVLLTRSQVTSTPQLDALITTATQQPANTPVGVVKTIQAAKDEANAGVDS